MANVAFKKGTLAQLNGLTSFVDGTLYITTDEGGIYLGTSATTKKRLGDVVVVANVAALPAHSATAPVSPDQLYYAASENILCRHNGTKWVQINGAGLAGVTVTGSGNAITNATVSVDATTGAKTLTLTKGETFVTKSTYDAKIQQLENGINALPTTTNISNLQEQIGAINTAIGATSESGLRKDIADVKKTAGDNATAINQINTEINTLKGTEEGSVAKAVSDAKTDLQNKIDAINTTIGVSDSAGLRKRIKDVETKATKNATDIGTANTDIGKLNTKVETLEGTVGNSTSGLVKSVADNTAAITKLNGSASTAGSVANAVNTAITNLINGAPTSFDTLKEIADWIADKDKDTTVSSLVTSVKDLKGDVTTLKGVGDGSVTKAVNDAKADLQDKIDTINNTTIGTDDTVGLRKRIKDVETKAGSNETAIGTINTEINTLKGTGDGSVSKAVNDAKNTLQDQINTINNTTIGTSDSTGLRKRIKDVETKASTNEGNITQAQSDISGLTTRMKTAETNINTLDTALTWGTF